MLKIISNLSDAQNMTNCVVCDKCIIDRKYMEYFHCGGHLTFRFDNQTLYVDLISIGLAISFHKNTIELYNFYKTNQDSSKLFTFPMMSLDFTDPQALETKLFKLINFA